MILLFFNKNKQNKEYDTNRDLSTFDTEPRAQFKSLAQPVASFYAPTVDLTTSCNYPLNIRELFPYWLRLTSNGDSVLISLTEKYYQWLTCNTKDINTLSFFRLEDLIDLENIPDELIEHLSNTYLNSLPADSINNNIVSPEKVKNIIDNIKVNLYSKKGAEDGFKYVINQFFGVDPDLISISYPKRYVLRLNGGRYDWMSDNLASATNYSTNLDDFYPQLTGSYLNYSVLYDNDLWQEHSYVVNVSGVSLEAYENVVKPILHPAGTKDFFQVRQDIFNNVSDATSNVKSELPFLANYALYKLGSTASIGYTFGCSGAYGGVTGQPIYVFPSWDAEISDKYYPGMSFGEINIGDFLYLTPKEGQSYPNTGLTCS
jgi:hypothetical protein